MSITVSRMARLVEMRDHKPLALDPKTMEKAVSVCRCGLSQDWPYCDNSHKETQGEEDSTMYAYHRTEPGGKLQSTIVKDPPDANPRP